ncbi:MAG: DUF488 domain-containing protein [Dehalococcoidales bacterium]|nr:DUF488 domain-containing protein [Dehalococcoidales bacterium]
MTNTEKVIFTIGHSTRTVEDFVKLLKDNNVARLADVRTVPRSRHNPQFNKEALPMILRRHDIKYLHMAGLGGLRHPVAGSPNTGWHNASFRGYADYMQTPEFEENLAELIKLAGEETICLMCAEAVPWRCHRSLIADALSIRSIAVVHILSQTSRRPHEVTPWAKISGRHITYPMPLS